MRREAVGPSVVRIGGSTYSKRPFEPQVRELKEVGFDCCELDLAWIEPTPQLEREAIALSEILPIETAHLPPSRFTREDQARFQRFLDYAAPAGPRIFNVHLLPAKAAAGVALDVRTAWLSELVDAAHARGLTVTLENVEEPLSILAEVFTRIPRMQACLDIGHASLDGDNERPFQLLSLIRDRLALVHAHDNRQGHSEAGDLHLPFGRGTIRLESILRAIRETGFDGQVTLELFAGSQDERAESAHKAREWLG
jgi:sugar phosphate isomerase/epimerase